MRLPSGHIWRVMSLNPVPLRTRHVEEQCTLNLSRAQTSSRGVPAQVPSSSLDHGSKLREIDFTNIPIIVADVENSSSIIEMCKRTKLLLNCVGPYNEFGGEEIVSACIECETHCIDLSAEIKHLDTVQANYFKLAEKRGVYIVQACGFGSLPEDYAIEFLMQKFPGGLNSVEFYQEFCDGPRPSKLTARRNRLGRKTLQCIFWDQKVLIYYELLKPGETVNTNRCKQQLFNLNDAILEKREQYKKRQHNVIFLDDNAPSHRAKPTKDIVKALGLESLAHAAYSPDLAPLDYHLFASLEHVLSDQRFTSYENVISWRDDWMTSKDRSFFWRDIYSQIARKLGKMCR
ncbi:mariner Mos1 transposase [Trichonephila clavipes]|nr:mariner Mos1 transposase [Trichonephila clavipes]